MGKKRVATKRRFLAVAKGKGAGAGAPGIAAPGGPDGLPSPAIDRLPLVACRTLPTRSRRKGACGLGLLQVYSAPLEGYFPVAVSEWAKYPPERTPRMTLAPQTRRSRPRALATSMAALLLSAGLGPAQTYTSGGSGAFTDPLVWNFGAGPVPASSATLALGLQSFGGALVAANDLSLTLQALGLVGNGTFTLSGLLGGGLAFTGAGLIDFGSSATFTLAGPIAFGTGLTSLTLDGAGPGALDLSGVLSSNTSTGAPLIVATDAVNAAAGIVTLSAANTFSGGVVLNSGSLNLTHARALGDAANVLTVNGGSLRATATVTIGNDVTLNSTLRVNGSASPANPATFTFTGVVAGTGGVTQSGAGLGAVLEFRGINTYTGATAIRGLDHGAAPSSSAASIHLSGAAGSILATSGIEVGAGGIFRLDYSEGHSAANTRVSAATALGVTGGFIEAFGNEGLVRQSLGTVNAGGLTTISANTNGGGSDLAGAGMEVTIANLQRAAGGTVTFTGANLGGAAVAPGLAAAQGNVLLTQIDGSAPAAALVGGGGSAGTSNISILPWALGDLVNEANRYDAGSGFVTYGANGVRLLDTITEYNTSNSFNSLPDNFQNVRIANSVSDPAAPVTVNSIFIESPGLSIGGANPITLHSGALATNVLNHTIAAPVNFGAGGAGEAVVSVIGTLNTPNSLTLTGDLTAGSLVKSGHGTLTLSGASNAIAGAITINAGQLAVDAITQLGGATALTFRSPSQTSAGATLFYAGGGADVLNVPVATEGGTAGFTVDTGALNVSGAITGAGGLRKDGAGSLALTGANTYSGGTYLGSGALEFDSDARLGAAGGFLHTSGGRLNLNGAWSSTRSITIDSGNLLTLSKTTNPVTLAGALDGTGPLQSLGSSTLTITGGHNGYAGAITLGSASVEGGRLALVGSGALNAASIVFGDTAGPSGLYALDLSAATAPSGTPWRAFNALTTAPAFGHAHSVQLGTTALTPVDLRLSGGSFGGTAGVLQGFGKLVKVGGGTLTLDGSLANTFTGGVEVWNGSLAFSADGQLGAPGNAVALRGGILNSTANGTTARLLTLAPTPQPILRGPGNIVPLAHGLGANSGTARTYSGTIGGPGGFNKTGTGTVILAGVNTYAGDTQISAGILAFTDNSQLGSASSRLRLSGNATLRLTASASLTYTVNRPIFSLGDTNTINVSITAPTLQLSSPILSAAGNELRLAGPGKFLLSADNRSFFGALRISSGGTSNTITLASTGQLRRGNLRVFGVDTSFAMGGLNRELGGVETLDAGSSIQLGSGGQLTTGFNNTGMTWAGSITQSAPTPASFFKTGTGNIALTATSTAAGNLTGGFHLLSGSGNTTTLSAGGALALQSGFTLGAWGSSANRGPLLVLDNAGFNSNTRLADTQALHSNAGEIQFTTNPTTATNEVVGSLRGAGMSTVTMTSGGTLNFSDAATGLTRVNGGTFLFRAGNANFGTGAASTSVGNLLFGNLPGSALVGGGGAAGTTTISILPFAVGGTTAASLGTNFVTYGANGIRVLNTTSETVNNVNAASLTGAANDNVRLNNSAFTTTTLGGGVDRTINALNLSGAAGTTRLVSAGAERLIVTSGTILSTAGNVFATTPASPTSGLPLGMQVAELQTGLGNTRELNVFTTGGDLALGARVTTTGGLTKSGADALYLTNTANTYGGTTTVNAGSLVVDDLAALGSGPTIAVGGGFLRYRGTTATLAKNLVAPGGSGAGLGASAGLHIVSGTTLSVPAGGVSGNGGLLKDGTGVLRLTGAHSQTGATLIAAGTLAIDAPGALGGNGRVVFTDSALGANGGQTLRFDAPMTLTQDFVVNSAQNGIGFGFDTNGNTVTLNGTLLDARNPSVRGLYKLGAGELQLTTTQMYTGPTQVFGGTLRLSGANGSVLNSTGTGGFNNQATILVNPGAALVLDNSAANNNNRLPDVWDTPFGTGNGNSGKVRLNGGELRLIGHAAGTAERINQLDILTGTVTLSGGGTTLTSGLLARAGSGAAGLLRGTNLGGTPGPANANWFVTDLGSGGPTLAGAGGAEGTPFVSILPGFMGDTSATGSGTDFLTYAADTGWRTLVSGEYAGVLPIGNFDPNRAPNVALSGAAAVGRTTYLTALKLDAGASVSGPGSLGLTQGTVLATGSASLGAPSLSAGLPGAGSAYLFLTAGAGTTLTVASTLPDADLTKYGAGTLALTGRHLGSGTVLIGQGTLRLDGADAALHPLASSVSVLAGATLDLGGADRVLGRFAPAAPITTATSLSQPVDGTVLLGSQRLTLYGSVAGAFAGTISGAGGLTKAFNSTAATTLSQPQSYTGSTILRGGTLALAGAGTLASSAVDIRGGRLLFNNADDNATSGYLAQRLTPATAITIGGGEVAFTVNANTPGQHPLATVALDGGASLAVAGTTSAPTTITIGNLTRATGRGTLSVSGANLGLAQSPTGGVRVIPAQIEGGTPSAALLGGGGGIGTTNQSLLPWAWAEATASFLTLGANGLRPLADSEYAATFGGATDNVRPGAASVLAGPATANALRTGFDVSGPFDLTLTSGGLVTTGTVDRTIGTSSNALLTGSSNARELVVHTSNAAQTLNLEYAVTTSGGVTKAGPGTLALNSPANSFTGGLHLTGGTVRFSTDSSLGAPGGAIRFGGSALGTVPTLRYESAPDAPLLFTRPIQTDSFGALAGEDARRWQLAGVISGPGGLRYAPAPFGQALYEIETANTYTAQTEWTGGHLYLRGDSAFGAGGELLLNADDDDHLVLRGPWTTNRLIHLARGSAVANSSLQTNGYDATWSGSLVGTSGLVKNGLGRLTLSQSAGWTGPLTVRAGEVRLRDRGSLAGSSGGATIAAGASFTLDGTGVHHSDRLRDSAGGLALNGGAFTLRGHSSVTTEEVLHQLSLNSGGASTLTFIPGAGQAAIVRISGLASVNGGASLWRGTGLGVHAPGTADSASLLLTPGNTNAFPLTGGRAPAGHPSIGIIAGGFGDTSATGLGTQLVTYDTTRGVRLLDPVTEFTSTWVEGSVVTDNVRLDATSLALAFPTTANALWLKGGASLSGAGEVQLTGGNLLVTDPGNSLANPVAIVSDVLAVGGPGNATLSGVLGGPGGVAKTGAGTLTLTAANTYAGDTTLAAGVLALGDASALSTGTLRVQGGELRNATAGPLSIANPVELNGPLKIGGTQDFTFTGNLLLHHATREIEVGASSATTITGLVSGSQALIQYGLTKTGPGLLVLANPANDYDGPTTIRGGILSIDTIANGSVGTLLNPSGLGQSWSDADQLVLDGGTLRYTGATASTDRLFTLTQNGGTLDASGTGDLTFSSDSTIATPGSGSRTLTLTGNNSTTNTLALSIPDGATPPDATSLSVSTTHWTLTNANPFTGATTVQSGTLEAAAAGALGSTASIAVNTGGTLLLSGSGDRLNNSAPFNLNGGKLDTGGTSEGSATVVGLGALTLSASSIIDFTGAAATLTFASGTYSSGTLTINNWSGIAETAGLDGVNDRLIFSGNNSTRLAFLSTFSPSSIAFAGFGSGYTALQFDANHFEVVPVPEPSGTFAALALLGLGAWREGRRRRAGVAPGRTLPVPRAARR